MAVVKNSHSTSGGSNGYVLVCLSTMVMSVGFTGSKHIEGLKQEVVIPYPSLLLRDFTFLESGTSCLLLSTLITF